MSWTAIDLFSGIGGFTDAAEAPGYSVALLARNPTAMLGRQLAPVDADDCAPGLEVESDEDTYRGTRCNVSPAARTNIAQHHSSDSDRAQDVCGCDFDDFDDCAAGPVVGPSLGDSP